MVFSRTLRVPVLLLALSISVFARARTSGYCAQGGQVSVTGSVPSSTKIQQSYPQCVLTIFYTGGASGSVTTNGTAVTWTGGTLFNANSGWPGLTMTINGTGYTIASVNSTTSITLTTPTSPSVQASPVTYAMPSTAPAPIFSDNAGTVQANPFTASRTGYWSYYADNGTYDISANGGGIPAPFTWGAVSIADPCTVNGNAFNAACFGAKANGASNDTAAIQAMFSARPTGATTLSNSNTPVSYLVTSTVTMTVPVGTDSFGLNSPGPVIDGGGATILCSQTSGPCLKLISANINARQGLVLKNLTVEYVGSSTGVTGILVQDFIQPRFDNVKILNFYTSGSYGMELNDTEIGYFTRMYFTYNYIAAHITNLSTTNKFIGADFEVNRQALLIDTGSTTFTCDQCVIESNTGVHAVEVKNMIGDPDGMSGTRFVNSYMENNGDGTANARALYFYADTGRFLLSTTITGNNWNTMKSGQGYPIEFAGPGLIDYVTFHGNQCNLGADINAGILTTGTASFTTSTSDNCNIPAADLTINNNDGSFLTGRIRLNSAVGIGTTPSIGTPGIPWTTGYFSALETNVLYLSAFGQILAAGSDTQIGTSMTPIPNAYITTITGQNVALLPGGLVVTGPTTVGGGASCTSGLAGARSFATNSSVTTFNSIAVGGGTNGVPIFCDGTNWRVG